MPATVKRRLDLSWMRPPAMPEDGNMALVDHLRELRYRVIVAALAIVVGMVVAWFFFNQLYEVVMWPYDQAVRNLQASRPDLDTSIVYNGVSGSFMSRLQIAGFAGIIGTCPIWLYQVWAFIAPGLLAKEKRWALYFLGSAIPLFLLGVATGYFVTPKGYEVMIGFVPENSKALALLDVQTFVVNEMKLLALFGVSFLLPVILVTLNLLGVVKAAQLKQFRTVAIFLCFVFGAVATPSTDPFSMCAMAIPMAVMYVIAEFICARHDKQVGEKLSDDVVELNY